MLQFAMIRGLHSLRTRAVFRPDLLLRADPLPINKSNASIKVHAGSDIGCRKTDQVKKKSDKDKSQKKQGTTIKPGHIKEDRAQEKKHRPKSTQKKSPIKKTK